MRVIVCGAGRVGYLIARHLASDGNNVTIVDQNDLLVRKAVESLDVAGVTGFASHPDTLERAGGADADMLVAATRTDEVNMVACQVAHSMFSVPRKIARVRAAAYLKARGGRLYHREHLPIDVIISPEIEVARAVIRRIEAPVAFDSISFMEGHARLVGLQLPDACPITDTPLRQLSELFSSLRALVVAIKREGALRIPDEEDQLFQGDAVYFLAATDDVPRTLRLFGCQETLLRSVTVVGGGNIGLEVARIIEQEKSERRVRVVERDRRQAEAVAEQLERTIVLHGDGMDPEMLREAQMDRADAVVGLTDDDRVNFLCCALAKHAGCQKALALSNEPSLTVLGPKVGIDAFIDPRQTTVSSILRHVRRGFVRNVYALQDGAAEVIEAQIPDSALIEGKRLRDCGFPADARVGAVLSGGEYKMPAGDLTLETGDTVVVFALREAVHAVEPLFQTRPDFR